MDTPSKPLPPPGSDDVLADAVHNLTLSEPSPPVQSATPEPNPWQATPTTDAPPSAPAPISLADAPTTSGFATPSTPEPAPPPVHADVLHAFDPLASPEEAQARDAWARAEAHPPPVPAKEPPAVLDLPTPAESPLPPPPPLSSTSAFPALAALARTFSIPLARAQRPQSIDTATSVPSPATLSSFATQQRRPTTLSVSGSPATSSPASAEGTPSHSRDGSPIPGVARKQKERDKDRDGAFDFQTFLDQMKLKGAEPVAKYLRSFLSNFAKRTFTVNDQVKLIHDFLNFIAGKMREADVWKNASDAEFDNALEGMEKLVMNRLYDYTFTPHIAAAVPARPVTSDDLERDRILTQRIALFGWLEEGHLDIPEGEGSKGFLMFAEQELLKINHYKAPRDKLICILNCCKVIFGLIRHLHHEEGADQFLPVLIFVVLKANPDHLLSNVEFINRFRNPDKLQSEAGYYLSSLMGAVSFIETMDHTSLSNITQEQFERNVESAISLLPPTPSLSEKPPRPPSLPLAAPGEEAATPLALPSPGVVLGEEARRLLQRTGDAVSRPLSALGRILGEVVDGIPNTAAEARTYLPGPFAPFEAGRSTTNNNNLQPNNPNNPNNGSGYGNNGSGYGNGGDGGWYGSGGGYAYDAMQTPQGVGAGAGEGMYQTPYKPRVRRSPAVTPGPEDTPSRAAPYTHQPLALGPSQPLSYFPGGPAPPIPPRVQSLQQTGLYEQGQGQFPLGAPSAHVSRTPTPNLDFGGMQAEIERAHMQASAAAKETLVQIFPGTDNEVIEWVLEANQGDLGRSIEALLELSSEQ